MTPAELLRGLEAIQEKMRSPSCECDDDYDGVARSAVDNLIELLKEQALDALEGAS